MFVIVAYTTRDLERIYNKPFKTASEAQSEFEFTNGPAIRYGTITNVRYYAVGELLISEPSGEYRTVQEQIRNAYNASMDRLDNG